MNDPAREQAARERLARINSALAADPRMVQRFQEGLGKPNPIAFYQSTEDPEQRWMLVELYETREARNALRPMIVNEGDTVPQGSITVATQHQHVCASCARFFVNMPKCSRCKSVWYCSAECQRTHWPVHKQSCSAASQ